MLPEDHPDHLSVEDLDTEELAKGRLKDKNGKFTGRPPRLLPRQILDAMRSEHHKRVNSILEESLSDMVKIMRGVAMDKTADPAVRLRAAIYIYERFMGKLPDRIEVNKNEKVDAIIGKILYEADETPIEQEIRATEEELERPVRTRRPAAARTRKRQV